MISPESIIFDLDQAIAEAGEIVILRRTFSTNLIPFDVNVGMILRGYDSQDLVGEITQQDQKFIQSPTEIIESQWPGFQTGQNSSVDNRIPRKNDIIISSRGKLTIQAAAGFYIQNILVRIEGRARGN